LGDAFEPAVSSDWRPEHSLESTLAFNVKLPYLLPNFIAVKIENKS